MHYRRVIREALQAQIVAAGTMAGANVFTGRAKPILEILRKKLGVVSIYTGNESSERLKDGHDYERSLTVSVELALGGGDDLDDALDAFALEVENAINANPTLGHVLSSDLSLSSTVSEITAAGQQLIGAVRMDYDATYYTDAAVADLFPVYPIDAAFAPGAVRPVSSGAVRAPADVSVPLAGPQTPHTPLPGAALAPDGWTPTPALTDLDGIVANLPKDPVDPPPPDPEPDPDPVDPPPDPEPDPDPVDPPPDPEPDPDPVDPPPDPDPVVPTVLRVEVANAGAPYAASFEMDAAGTVSQLPNLASTPEGNSRAVAVSPSGAYMAIGFSVAPFLAVYQRVAGAWVRMANPVTPVAGSVGGVAFTRDNRFLILAHSAAPFATIYDLSGGTLAPVALGTTLGSNGYAVATSPVADVAVITLQSAPYAVALKLVNGAWTKLPDPAVPLEAASYGVDIAQDGSLVALSLAAAPHVAVYQFGETGFGTRWANPGITAGSGRGVAITPDKSRLFLGHLTAPYMMGLTLGPSAFAGTFAVPALPGFVLSLDIDPRGEFMAAAHYGLPFLTVFDLADPALAAMPLVGRPANNGAGVAIYDAPED